MLKFLDNKKSLIVIKAYVWMELSVAKKMSIFC